MPRALPAPAHPLVGRRNELSELVSLLSDGRRLVTITGSGGTGKSRLALEVAGQLLDRFEREVAFVELAPVRDPALVASTLAQTLELTEQPGQAIEDTLRARLSQRPSLLVLDNFEHLLDAAPFVADLLQTAEPLRVLVASRSPLHLSGEQEYPLEPLEVEEAAALFASRARAVDPRFDAAPDDELMREICRRLDCLPLALELAAARVKLLSPQTLLDRLVPRLPLLTGGARDLPERQRTLRATIDWSYDLLTAKEQQLFRRLAVFAGGATLESAEEVCDADLETLFSLVDRSLIRRRERRDVTCFWMLETVREYALEQLEASGEAEDTQARHAAHFADFVRRAVPELDRSAGRHWLERARHELDNLRASSAL